MIYRKATGISDAYRPASEWGAFTRYLEIGDDLYAVRHVDVFHNGNVLRYDRENWTDEVGQLADMKYDAAKWGEWWGPDQASDVTEFEAVWAAAEHAPNQPQTYNHDHGPWPVLKKLDGHA